MSAAADLIRADAVRSIVGIRNDSACRTSQILAKAGTSRITVDGPHLSSGGAVLGTKSWPLPSLGITRGSAMLAGQMRIAAPARDAQLLLSDSTPGGSLVADATVIDNATNDMRTFLPR